MRGEGGSSFTSRSVIDDCKETSTFAKANEVGQANRQNSIEY